MHSKKFEDVKTFYKNKLWDINKVRNAVGRWITPEEFKEITGQDY